MSANELGVSMGLGFIASQYLRATHAIRSEAWVNGEELTRRPSNPTRSALSRCPAPPLLPVPR